MQYNRVKWACRRGMLELDLVLQPFVDEAYPNLSVEEQALFQKLLECEDQELYAWFMRSVDPEKPSIRQIVDRVLEHMAARKPT